MPALIVVSAVLILSCPSSAQGTSSWAIGVGSGGWEVGESIAQTSDGGYVVGGESFSAEYGCYNLWAFKLDPVGNIEWQKSYGNPAGQSGQTIIQLPDGGYAFAGYSGGYEGSQGGICLLRLDSLGNLIWQKAYGYWSTWGTDCLQATPDGGMVILGVQEVVQYNDDYILIKVDANGEVEWEKRYGGPEYEWPFGVTVTSDGGYILAGSETSFADCIEAAWILKLDASGNIIWQKAYGESSSGLSFANSVRETDDGGYIVAGFTDTYGYYDKSGMWLLKLDALGNIEWEKTFGGEEYDSAYYAAQTADGGYVTIGLSDSFSSTNEQIWLMKLDSNGKAVWQKTFGDYNAGWARKIVPTSDGGAVFTGLLERGHRSTQAPVVKLTPEGAIPDCSFLIDTNARPAVYQTNTLVTEAVPVSLSGSAWPISLVAKDTASWGLKLCVIPCPAITIAPETLPDGEKGTSFNAAISAEGGEAPYRYALMTGDLPPGLSISVEGTISGIPETAGTYGFAISASDANDCSNFRVYQVNIIDPVDPPVISSLKKLGSPFRVKIYGSNIMEQVKVYIGENDLQWTDLTWKSGGEVLLRGGKPLKAVIPKNTPTRIKLVNPDGGVAETVWQWL